jgi:hypothetical protein
MARERAPRPPRRSASPLRAWALATTLSFGVAACAPSHPPSASPSPSATIPWRVVDGFPAPATYQQACYYEPDVCSSNDSQLQNALAPLPSALTKPLRLPLLQPGQRCPATPGGPIETSAFGGVALGSASEPIRLLGRVTAAGVGELGPTPSPSGWYDFKTLWFSAPSYQGPWIVRGEELGGANPVIFGEQPAVSQLVVPPIQTLNGANGYREAPGGTYVRTPGCYAWQVDCAARCGSSAR